MRARFAPRMVETAGKKAWRVYDLQRACFPYVNAEVGRVQQDLPNEGAARDECLRLATLLGLPAGAVGATIAATGANTGSPGKAARAAKIPQPAEISETHTSQSSEDAAQPPDSATESGPLTKTQQSASGSQVLEAPSGMRLGAAQRAVLEYLDQNRDGVTAKDVAEATGMAAANAATVLRKFTEAGMLTGDGGRPQVFTVM